MRTDIECSHSVRKTDHRAAAATPKKIATRTPIPAAQSNAQLALQREVVLTAAFDPRLCRDLAVEAKRIRRLQEQADELRRVIRKWANPRRTGTATALIVEDDAEQ